MHDIKGILCNIRFVVTFPERFGTLLDNLPPPPQAQVCIFSDNFAAKQL